MTSRRAWIVSLVCALGCASEVDSGAFEATSVPWRCPPPVSAAAAPDCRADFRPGTAFCTAAGVLTAAGLRRADQCNGAPNPNTLCSLYLDTRQCFSDCTPCQQSRLVGYYQTCRNMGQVAAGILSNAPASYGACRLSCAFQSYVSGMRGCLQRQASNLWATWNRDQPREPISCQGVIDGPLVAGTTQRDNTQGIIGSHTYCNDVNNFCGLASSDRQCFGAGLGNSWGGLCLGPGGHSPWGPWQSVGMCHMLAQAAQCGTRASGRSVASFIDSLCQGYQDGCMTTTPCAYMPQRSACTLACPKAADMAWVLRALSTGVGIAGGIPANTTQALRRFMDALNRVVAGDASDVATLEALCDQMVGRSPLPGVSCDPPAPAEPRCCCRQANGTATGYTTVRNCTAGNGNPTVPRLYPDMATCNMRGWTVADCNGAPRPGEATPGDDGVFCFSTTLNRRAGLGACVQSTLDRQWYQCTRRGWEADRGLPASNRGPYGACTAVHRLP